jgi:hypothetical protein
MTYRLPVSNIQNKWNDAQRVNQEDLNVEQSFVNNTTAAIVNNFMGSGVLLESPVPKIIFDSDNLDITNKLIEEAGDFDGHGISIPDANQPTDKNLGNQLAIELSGSSIYGRSNIKVLIIGLSFDDEIIQERFYFHRNETQVTENHYKKIITLMFNDFLGNKNGSKNDCGARIIIREAKPFEISRDPIMIAQDVEPNLFYRDFKVYDSSKELFEVMQEALGAEWNADALQINITGKQPHRELAVGDITTQIGQKFLATTDNIQKITLLLGVDKEGSDPEHWFDWDGDLVVSIHALQTSINNPTDIIPELAIDYDPNPEPIVQIAYSQSDLKALGHVLTDLAQPIDFVFSNTIISKPGGVQAGNYYIVTIKRSGSASFGTIFAETGNNRTDNSRISVFNTLWVDSNNEDLWFQVWTNACKISDGQGYDAGKGIAYDKITVDSTTGAQIDNKIKALPFVTSGENEINNALLQYTEEDSLTIQDERTGNNIYSRQKYVPSFSFVTTTNLNELKKTTDPLIVGSVVDSNPRTTNMIDGYQEYPNLAKGNVFTIIEPDSSLLSNRLIGRRLIPNVGCNIKNYRIYKVNVCENAYGDVNGDGIIDKDDVNRLSEILTKLNSEGSDGYIISPITTQLVTDGYFSLLELLRGDVNGDGKITIEDVVALQDFVNRTDGYYSLPRPGTSFTSLDLFVQQSVGRYDNYYEYIETDAYCVSTNENIRYGVNGDVITPVSSLTSTELLYYGYNADVNMDVEDPAVISGGYNYQIVFQPFWKDYLINLTSDVRYLPASFISSNGFSFKENPCEDENSLVTRCKESLGENPPCDPGKNDIFLPGNLILGKGQILRPNGEFYKPDIEVGTIILELPTISMTSKQLNIFTNFVAESSFNSGKTVKGFPAMKYSDCSYVQLDDLANNKVRFNVSIQSIYPELDGYEEEDGYGLIINNGIGIYINQEEGILRVNVADLGVDLNDVTLKTKLQIEVLLKKSGWNNKPLTVNPDQTAGLLIDN